MLRTALALAAGAGCGVDGWGGGGPTSQRRLVLEVGVFVFPMALNGLLEAVDALHVGRNAVGIAGGRTGRRCGMAAVAGVEGCAFKSSHEWAQRTLRCTEYVRSRSRGGGLIGCRRL
jgi:hypothetical protein